MPTSAEIVVGIYKRYITVLNTLRLRKGWEFAVGIRADTVDILLAELEQVRNIVQDPKVLTELATLGAVAVQQSILRRAEQAESRMGAYYYQYAGGISSVPWTRSNAMTIGWDQTLNILAHKAQTPRAGVAVAINFDELDQIRLTTIRQQREVPLELAETGFVGDGEQNTKRFVRLNRTEYDVVWRIFEFGTGIYADPRTKRLSGPTKAPGLGGAWYYNIGFFPGTNKLIKRLIFGQTGTHFLFGARADDTQARQDRAFAELTILNRISQLLERARGG